MPAQPILSSPPILIVDDEKNIRATLAVCLTAMGCEVAEAATGEEALRALGRGAPLMPGR